MRRLHSILRKNARQLCEEWNAIFGYLQITEDLGATVYFADQYAFWQKGAIENTNKPIRQYISKSANFDEFTDKIIMMIQKKTYRRLREKLGFKVSVLAFYRK